MGENSGITNMKNTPLLEVLLTPHLCAKLYESKIRCYVTECPYPKSETLNSQSMMSYTLICTYPTSIPKSVTLTESLNFDIKALICLLCFFTLPCTEAHSLLLRSGR